MFASYSKVLLATDLTATASSLTGCLFALCPDTDTEIVVTHVVEDDPDPHSSTYTKAVETLEDLVESLNRAGYDNVTLSVSTSRDEPSEVIHNMADEGDFDLVLVASHGKSFWESTIMGSTTYVLARTANYPLFIWKEDRSNTQEEANLLQRILLPTDFSRNSLVALSVIRNFRESIKEVILAHVIEKSRSDKDLAHKKELAAQKLQELVEELGSFGVKASYIIDKGTASKHLKAIAEHRDITLTIMSKTNKGFAEGMLGSTSKNYALNSDRPILLLPPEEIEEDE